MKIYPACLPIKQRKTKFGIHSGWSTPVPFHILWKYAPLFTKVYRDFFKQVQYKMVIPERCEDDNLKAESAEPAIYTTNTYYPPGKKEGK